LSTTVSWCSSKLVDSFNWGEAIAMIDYDRTKEESQSNWCSNNIENSYFIIEFPKNRVHVTDYSLVSRNYAPADMPRTWRLDGSLNGVNWHYIDKVENYEGLKEKNTLKTFHVKKPGAYKLFRFMQTGPSSRNLSFFTLGKVELFGEILRLNKEYQKIIIVCQ